VLVPNVEIVQYEEAVEDVPQSGFGPTHINVALKEKEAINTYEPLIKIQKEDQIASLLPERKNNRRVKPIRHEHKLTFTSQNLTFQIWDAQVIDGDIVSIFVGNECIVEEYSITAVKKSVQFDASKYKRTYVYLHAHNLGTLPPNTVTMTVSDGENTHEVELRSDMTGSSALQLTFETED
jgi:hypothetical protein